MGPWAIPPIVARVKVLNVQQVSQREVWNSNPEELRELFTLTNASHAHARCALWVHLFGRDFG
jgi:hypothetical protein